MCIRKNPTRGTRSALVRFFEQFSEVEPDRIISEQRGSRRVEVENRSESGDDANGDESRDCPSARAVSKRQYEETVGEDDSLFLWKQSPSNVQILYSKLPQMLKLRHNYHHDPDEQWLISSALLKTPSLNLSNVIHPHL